MEEALRKVRSEFGREYRLRIGSEWIATGDKLASVNPSDPTQVVGVHHKANAELANRAVEAAFRRLPRVGRTPAEERIRMLARDRPHPARAQARIRRLAGLRSRQDLARSRGRRHRSHRLLRILRPRDAAPGGPQPLVQLPGERDEMLYIPLGVGIVIPPWNFPLAILAGMTVASLVAGNTVIIKPSSETPTIAAKFAEVLLEAGFPEAASPLLAGSGAVVGDTLVEHPKTRFICLHRLSRRGPAHQRTGREAQPGQIWIKRVIAEMGGKDAIVVDAARRSRQGRGRRVRLRLRLPGPEVLRLLARHRRRPGLRRVPRETGGQGRDASRWARRRPAPTTWGR